MSETSKPHNELLVWLDIDANTSVSAPLDEALDWTERDFETFYRKHVYGSKKKTARTWAKEQVRKREEALRA